MPRLIITGPPNIGKTTLVNSVVKKLSNNNKNVIGFVTNEIRSEGSRIGFQLQNLSDFNDKTNLASLTSSLPEVSRRKLPTVSKYSIHVSEFEDFYRNIFFSTSSSSSPSSANQSKILVIDEIGKMELFSKSFVKDVTNLIKNNENCILVVAQKGPGFINKIKEFKEIDQVITINFQNRNLLCDEVVDKFV